MMRTHRFSAVLLAFVGSHCDSPPPAEPDNSLRPPPAPSPFADTGATSIGFVGATASRNLVAGVPTRIEIQVQPPAEYTVRFSVIGGDEPFNVFLENGEAETDSDGVASVTVHARGTNSNTPRLVAAVGNLSSAPLFLSVGASTDATLNVRALEPAGSTRIITEWVLSAHIDTACSDLEGSPPPDGELRTRVPYLGPEQEVVLARVPAGQSLAIVLRAGQYAGACQNIRPLTPNKEYLTDLEVSLRPMHLDKTSLALSFGLDEATEFDTLYRDFAFRVADAISQEDSDDLDAVFDAMALASQDPAAFDLARTANAWRAIWLIEQGTSLAGAGTRDLLRSWMQSGLDPLATPQAFQGVFSVPNELGEAVFTLNSVAGENAELSGFSVPTPATIVANANDFLQLNLALRWQPATYLFAAAQRQAIEEQAIEGPPSTSSVPSALASAFDCPKLGAVLTAASPAPSLTAFDNCDPSCIQQLCEQAMTSIWTEMTNIALPEVQWEFAASAQASIDNVARPELAEGGSLHTLNVEANELSVTGTFRTVALATDDPPADPPAE